MKQLFKFLWIVLPLPAALPLLFLRSGGFGDWFSSPEAAWYWLSMVTAVCAWFWLVGQLILSARPFSLHKWLGLKELLAFHRLVALLALAAIQGHLFLKLVVLGYAQSGHTLLGFLANLLFLLSSILGWLLLYPPAKSARQRLKGFRDWAFKAFNLNHARSRVIHNLVLLGLVLAAVHGFMASAVQDSPATASFMVIWLVAGVAFQLVWRLKGRKT